MRRAHLFLYGGNAVILAVTLGIAVPLRIGAAATAIIVIVASLIWTIPNGIRFRSAFHDKETGTGRDH